MNIGRMPELEKEVYSVFDFQPDGDFQECYLAAKTYLEIMSDGGLVWQKAGATCLGMTGLGTGAGGLNIRKAIFQQCDGIEDALTDLRTNSLP